MTVDECVKYWEDTGDTRFEAYIGMDLIEMVVDNETGEPEIVINDTGIDLAPEDVDTWNRY